MGARNPIGASGNLTKTPFMLGQLFKMLSPQNIAQCGGIIAVNINQISS
jgi:hypothetical protein